MKIDFKKIKTKNFLSIGSCEVELTYASGINAIVAKQDKDETTNGKGKSTILIDALVFALYGKSIRDLNKKSLVNDINESNCEVTLWLSINNIPYRIERGIAPDYFNFINESENAVNNEEASKNKTKQNIEDILKISYTSFINAITLNINYSQPFFKLPAADRRKVLEDVFNLNIYGKMYEKIKKEWNQNKTEKKYLEKDIEGASELYSDKKSTFEKLEIKRKEFENKKQEKVNELKVKLEETTKKLNAYKSKIPDKDFVEIKKKIETAKTTLTNHGFKLDNEISNYSSNIIKCKNEIENIQKNPICPYCKTPTTESTHTQTHIEKLQKEISENISKKEELTNKKCELRPKLKDIENKLDKVEDVIKKVNTLKTLISNTEVYITNIESELEKEESSKFDMESIITQNDVDKAKTQLDKKNSEYNDVCKTMKFSEFAKEILGDQGIKKYIIKKILPILNKKTNEYLSLFKAQYTLSFDSELNEIFKTRSHKEKPYKGFSAGEQKRIDLAFMFALLDVAKSQHSIDSNILILDEIIDSSLCSNGIMHLMNFLKGEFIKSYPNLCVYIISHKSEISEDNFNRIITITKETGFTKIDSIREIEQDLQV